MSRISVLLLIAAWAFAPPNSASAQAADSVAQARASGPYASAEATLDSLRSDPALRYEVDPESSDSLWSRFWRGIERILGRIFDGNAGYFTRPVLYSMMGLLLVWAIVLVARSDVRVLRRGTTSARASGGSVLPDDITREDYARLAQSAEERGELREALRYRFLHVLQRLDATGRSGYRPDKTHEAYAADLPADDRAPFFAVARPFERVWYGGYAIDEARYPAVREAALGLVGALKPQPA